MSTVLRAARALLLLAALAAAHPTPAAAQPAHLAQLHARLQERLEEIARATPGVLGVAVLDLTTGATAGVNQELEFPQGSSIKIPVLLELFHRADAGELRLEERIEVRREEMAGGSGILQRFGDGTSALALRDLAVLMIVLSDNTATNLLIDRLGMDAVNRLTERLGAPRTRLQRRMIRPADSAAGRENLSTPAEAAALMAKIARCEIPVAPERCAELRRILEISKGGAFVRDLPSDVRVAWKPGSVEGVAAAWGIVDLPGRPYVVAAMVNYGSGQEGEAIREVSAAAYQHFRALAGATPYGTRVPLRFLQPDTLR